MLTSIIRLIIISVLLLAFGPLARAEEEPTMDSSTLSGGIVQREGLYLPRGLSIPVELRTPVDTRINKVSDVVTVQTTEDLMLGDFVLIPANSFLHGHISELKGPGRWHKAPKVNIDFDTVSMPGEAGSGRKYISIKGSIKERQVIDKSDKVTYGGANFKSKATKAAAVGGVTGGAVAFGMTNALDPFATYGMEGLLNNTVILGSGLAGAYLATNLIKKDDVRIEPGTQLSVVLDEPSVEGFRQNYALMYEQQVEKLDSGDAYDRIVGLESQSIY